MIHRRTRRPRRHAAGASRILLGGVSASATLALVGVLTAGEHPSAPAASATTTTTAGPPPTVVIYQYRLVPAASPSGPTGSGHAGSVGASSAASRGGATAAPAASNPAPATRTKAS